MTSGLGGLFPSNAEIVYVRGQFIDLGGAAMKGAVTFTPNFGNVLLDVEPKLIIGKRGFSASLDNAGKFAIALPSTDDPDILPVDWTYTVAEPTGRTYQIAVPAETPILVAGGDPLNGFRVLELITVVPAPAPASGTVQLLPSMGPPGVGVESVTAGPGNTSLVVALDDGSSYTVPVPAGGGGGTAVTVDGDAVTSLDIESTPITPESLDLVESAAVRNIVTLTQAAYDALATTDANTLYVVTG